jgi:hypothetical protein
MEMTPTATPSIIPKRKPDEKTMKVKNSTFGTESIGSFNAMARATKIPMRASFLAERLI